MKTEEKFQHKCRTCGKPGKRFKEIFKILLSSEIKCNSLPQLIATFLNVKVKQNDHLPKKICYDCRKKLETWQNFYNLCERTQRHLEEEYKNAICSKAVPPADTGVVVPVEDCKINAENIPQSDSFPTEDFITQHEFISLVDDNFESEIFLCQSSNASTTNLECIATSQENNVENSSSNHSFLKNNSVKNCLPIPKPENHFPTDTTEISELENVCAENNDKSTCQKSVLPPRVEKREKKNRKCKEGKFVQKDQASSEPTLAGIHQDTGTQGARRTRNSKPKIKSDSNSNIKIPKKCRKQNTKSNKQPKPTEILKIISFRCSVCEKGFTDRRRYNSHMAKHRDTTVYECKQCDKKLSNKFALRSHMDTHLDTRQHCCHVCGVLFKTASCLYNHVKIHQKESKKFVCDQCGKQFVQSNHLVQHTRIHTGERPYHCKECPRRFACSSQLKRHIHAVHMGLKKFMCNVCGKGFLYSNNYKAHLLFHEGQRNKKCNTCGKAFLTSNALFRHTRLHTGDKPFKCDFCGQTFADCSNRKRHMMRHQKDEPKSGNHKKLNKESEPLAEVDSSKTFANLCTFLESTEVVETIAGTGEEVETNEEPINVEFVTLLSSEDDLECTADIQEIIMLPSETTLNDYGDALKPISQGQTVLGSVVNAVITKDGNIIQLEPLDTGSLTDKLTEHGSIKIFEDVENMESNSFMFDSKLCSPFQRSAGNSLIEVLLGDENLNKTVSDLNFP